MIANKRTPDQMVEDLKLFLNDEADKFVLWLKVVLSRIQKAMELPDIDGIVNDMEGGQNGHTADTTTTTTTTTHALDEAPPIAAGMKKKVKKMKKEGKVKGKKRRFTEETMKVKKSDSSDNDND